jgi:hypothetical protein
MAKITDHLQSWEYVEKKIPIEDRGLLVGNGASVAVWPSFKYKSLYEVARDPTKPDHLKQREIAMFSSFKTQNFEAVLSAMITAGTVWGIYNKPDNHIDDLRQSYKRVRKSLIRSVREVHIPFDEVTDGLKSKIRSILAKYDYIYSTNYDLLLYWSMMTDKNQFKDFIWASDVDGVKNYFDATDTDLWDIEKPVTKVLYVHGALHLYKQQDGRTFKKLAGEGGDLLELFDVQGDAIPLFISEGTSKDKLSAITRNDYLSFAYQRFAKHRGSLVIFGHSLTPEFDQHLLDAMRKWKRYDQRRKPFQRVPDRRVIAISVLPSRGCDHIIQFKSRLKKVLSDYDVAFFDATTHPLATLASSAVP